MTIEKIKTICENKIDSCNKTLKFIKDKMEEVNDSGKLYYEKIEFENRYKTLFIKTEWEKILDTLSIGKLDDFERYARVIRIRLLEQAPMPYTTNPINNICSVFEFECLQEIYNKMNYLIDKFNNNKDDFKDLKKRFIEYAKQRAKESLNTSYAWEWEHLYPTEEDENFFMQVIEECDKGNLDWKNEHTWAELIDWFEDLPQY